MKKKGIRWLHINGVQYKWQVSKHGTVTIELPDGKEIYPSGHEVVGLTPFYFEKGQYKGTIDGMVTPERIKKYIINNILTEAAKEN